MMKPELTGEKKLRDSKTVKANVLSILASVGTIAAIIGGGAEPTVAIPAIVTAVGSIWGNIASIIGRKNATEKIQVSK